MPAGPEGIPTVYEVDGREYVAFSADPVPESSGTEGRKLPPPDPSVQGYYVFALPKNATARSKR
jgi:quinoprotein glucose dehydrogenase